jgi:hypothetical protein
MKRHDGQQIISKRQQETRRGAETNRTNGFRAFMRVLKPLYLRLVEPGDVPSLQAFNTALVPVSIEEGRFNTTRFPPGSSGEAGLFRQLKANLKL